MTKCLNCSAEADYIINGKTLGQVFCKAHLPWFVNLNKDLGTKVSTLEVIPAPVVVEEAPVELPEPKKSSKKKEPKEPVVTEPVAEPVEEVVVEEEK